MASGTKRSHRCDCSMPSHPLLCSFVTLQGVNSKQGGGGGRLAGIASV